MNYVILNYPKFFRDQINLKNFKEVDLFGEERVDAVFGCISKELLEHIDFDTEGGDSIFPGSWLLRDAGIFVLLKIDRSILLDENQELIETLLGFLDSESFYITIRGFNLEESYNQIEQYIFGYRKNLGFVENLFQQQTVKNSLEYILEEIEKKIL